MVLTWNLVLITVVTYCGTIVLTKAQNAVQINEYLIQNADGLDFQSNIEAAQKFLESEQAKPIKDEKLVADLQTLISLQSVESRQVFCTRESVAILSANNRLVNDLFEKVSKVGVNNFNRLEEVIYNVHDKHAHECYFKYKKGVNEKELDQNELYKVGTMTSSMVHDIASKTAPVKYEDLDVRRGQEALVDMVQKLNDEDRRYASLVTAEFSGGHILNEEKYTQLYEKYVRKPCGYFISKLGDVIEPAIYDANIMYPLIDWEIFIFNTCKVITGDRSQELLDQMIDHSKHVEYRIW